MHSCTELFLEISRSKPEELVGRDIIVDMRGYGDRISAEVIFSAPVQAGTGTHTASYKMGTESSPEGKLTVAWR
jgi:hypothetical protein